MSGVSAKTKRSVLLAAGVILIIAIVWLIILESTSYTRALSNRINSFGYNSSPSELNIRSYGKDLKISDVLDKDLSLVTELSKECGFPADTEKSGQVELALWRADSERVMVIYLVDHEPELAFIENTVTGEVLPINSK